MTIEERDYQEDLRAIVEFEKSRERFLNQNQFIKEKELDNWHKDYLKRLNERHKKGYNKTF